ncbi:MAG TPA: ribosome rescue protein RqcH [Candidatus Bathyarchaeia archaeon]
MPKKEFTNFDVSAVVHELEDLVANSRVNNVYQLNEKTLLLKLHKTDMPPLRLTLEAGRRLHLTSYVLEKPHTPPAFCMALRKYLRNAWLRNVEQHEFERIAMFSFDTNEGKLLLILELFGEGNIILASEKGEILQALIYKRMRDRNIVRGETYQFPPTSGKNPLKITQEELAKTLTAAGEVEVVRALARSLGVGGVYAEEILLRAEVEKTRTSTSATEVESSVIYDSLQSLIVEIASRKTQPVIVLDESGGFVDAVPFKLKRYEDLKFQAYPSFNEALDEFYLRVAAAEKVVEATVGTDELQREANRLKRVVAEQNQALREAENRAESEKKIGTTIYAHSIEIQELLDKFNNAKLEGRDWDAVVSETLAAKAASKTPEALYEFFDARNQAVNICVENLRFSVGFRKTLFENAAEYFDRSKKAKQKAAGALTALEESRQKLAEVEKRLSAAEAVKLAKPSEVMEDFIKRKVEGKQWFEKFRWFTSSEGYLVVAGKDTVSNEVLVKKNTSEGDIVFHADIMGAPFVVVKTEGKIPGEQTLREAGEFAAAFSRAWREGLGSLDVYWVKPSQLSKTGPSGEYVAHGAFAVVGKRNWLRNLSLKVAVGIFEDEDGLRFVGGPVNAVKTKTKVYVVLGPGDLMGKEILKKIFQALAVKLSKEQREEIVKASLEQVRELVPYTKGRLTETS